MIETNQHFPVSIFRILYHIPDISHQVRSVLCFILKQKKFQ